MSRKKRNVVGANWCKEMEQLRVALEVCLGERVRFKQIDFDKKTATVFVGLESKEREVYYHIFLGKKKSDIEYFCFKEQAACANVEFDEEGTVAVEHWGIRDGKGDPAVWLGWGYAPNDRHLQSLQTPRPGDQLI